MFLQDGVVSITKEIYEDVCFLCTGDLTVNWVTGGQNDGVRGKKSVMRRNRKRFCEKNHTAFRIDEKVSTTTPPHHFKLDEARTFPPGNG